MKQITHWHWLIVLTAIATGLVPMAASAQHTAAAAQGWQDLDNPALPDSLAPRFAQAADGNIYMSWLEKQRIGGDAGRPTTMHTLKFAQLHSSAGGLSFSVPVTIASGSDWFANWADTPALHVHSERLWLAHWLQKSAASTYAYDIMVSRSGDQGQSWSPPVSPHRDMTPTEHGFVSYYSAGQQQVGLVWLDGRATATGHDRATLPGADTGMLEHGVGGKGMTLRTATLDEAGNIRQEQLLDRLVCDCCQTAVAQAGGTTIIAYRNRTVDEIRDIAVVRNSGHGWSDPQIAHTDGWNTSACPVNGPALAASGDRVALAWFTMAGLTPRVQLALSADAGASFRLRQTLSEGTAMGRVQITSHGDGWLLSWMDRPPGAATAVIRLAHLDQHGDLRWQQQLDGVSAQRVSGVPRMVVLADGGIVMAWTGSKAGQGGIQTAVYRPENVLTALN